MVKHGATTNIHTLEMKMLKTILTKIIFITLIIVITKTQLVHHKNSETKLSVQHIVTTNTTNLIYLSTDRNTRRVIAQNYNKLNNTLEI